MTAFQNFIDLLWQFFGFAVFVYLLVFVCTHWKQFFNPRA